MSSSRVLNSFPFWLLGVTLPVTHSIRVLFGCRCWVTMTLLHLPCTHPLSADFLYRPIRESKPLRSVYCWNLSRCTFPYILYTGFTLVFPEILPLFSPFVTLSITSWLGQKQKENKKTPFPNKRESSQFHSWFLTSF